MEAGRVGDVVSFEGEGHRARLRGGAIAVERSGEVVGTLHRVERASATLGAAAPEGAVVLFDGTGTRHWIGGRMTGDGLLMEGTTSARTFQDFKLHIEFRTPFRPWAQGQQRGNSGVYLQGRYEVQILDSFGLEGRHNECGGIYGVKAPEVNMCYPPLTWQTYDIEFAAPRFDESGRKTANARVTVRHNGVLVHEEGEVGGATAAAPGRESPAAGAINLQSHGNPVRFRNIWVVEKR